jgi:hypothetical protein
MRPLTFSGWRLPIELSSSPAIECPTRTGFCSLRASMTARTSSPRRSDGWGGLAGVAEAAAGHAVDMALAGKFRCKLVEDIRGVAQTGEEDERASGAAQSRTSSLTPGSTVTNCTDKQVGEYFLAKNHLIEPASELLIPGMHCMPPRSGHRNCEPFSLVVTYHKWLLTKSEFLMPWEILPGGRC